MVPIQKLTKSQLTIMCKLGGRGPNTENFKKKFYKQCKLGLDDEINFAKISFQSHSQEPFHNKSLVILYYFSSAPSS
ncbi:hypothetical protein HMPREF0769_11472 [Staphylococcus aureus subsp. aureus MN8]|uniref:Nitrogen regulation protein NIFR3 n=1 Tax=Staphylococcus aureus subsp. aureus MN8 TaxID=548470 RepID=A0A0E1X7A9_STAAU|nr:hypothetical protein HMPREF0769_11472 [Staphylococcus aureus subsp. aureus MN8]